jgi:2-oxoglutarate dehydrogenase E2 component (dihydrolipoamide succinyltransferase)
MGESIAEGTLSRWLKKVGDEVKRDEPIFEISTDKVDAEIPSPVAGVLAEILVNEGQTVAIQTVVARLETEKGAALSAPAQAVPAVAAATAPAPVAPQRQSSVPAAVPARTGNGDSFEERIRTKSSPLVRKIAAEHGLDIAAMQGSGIAGRVTKRDIVGFIESGTAPARMPATSGAGAGNGFGGADAGPMPEPGPGDKVEPMSKMRALISDHMTLSRRTSAHVQTFFEIDLTRVARIRAKKRAQFEAATGEKLTYMPFIIRAVTQALKAYPILNSSVAGTSVIYRKNINIGIAVALEWGLIVPVIRNADDLSLSGITKALNDLASRARAKRLDPREVQDGTFTITNHGAFGSLTGTPIINQPQVAILGVGAIEKRPKVLTGTDGEDVIAIRTCSFFSLSFDHRIIDGAVADQFLGLVKKTIETFPESEV